jgi:enediyne polyketide synthase
MHPAPGHLPLWRFLETPRIHYPGVELSVDCRLSVDTDPYLKDHVLDRQALLPAVMGLEAMAQVACAAASIERPSGFSKVEFIRPVSVPDGGLAIRVSAVLARPDAVDVTLASAAAPSVAFRASVHSSPAPLRALGTVQLPDWPAVGLGQPDLYGPLLFQKGRFQRVAGYRLLSARRCIAELEPPDDGAWFSPFMPGELLLPDPSARDAAIHAIQGCHPGALLIPVAVETVSLSALDGHVRFTHAREVARHGDRFTYDVELAAEDGRILERWQGLVLQSIGHAAAPKAAPLLAPYLQRLVEPLLGSPSVNLAADRATTPRRPGSDSLLVRAAERRLSIARGGDGRPQLGEGAFGSVSHSAGLSIAAVSPCPVACDLQQLEARSDSVWSELLGSGGRDLVSQIMGSGQVDLDVARNMVWAARECLFKLGRPGEERPRVVASASPGVALATEAAGIACVCVEFEGNRLVFALATGVGSDETAPVL